MKRLFIACSVLLFVALQEDAKAAIANAIVFKLSLTGTDVQSQVIMNPGVKPPTGKVNDKAISEVLKGEKNDFSSNYVNVDPNSEGGYFLFYVSKDEWRVADNSAGTNATVLTGRVDNIGNTLMYGTYSFIPVTPPTDDISMKICVVGKVKFAPNTFNPTSVSGSAYLASTVTGDNMVLKFKTVGKPLN